MSDNTVEKIINTINISEIIGEYLPLKKSGRNFWGLCPFHDDKSPSMSVSDEKKIYKCFSCGAGGNVITFVSEKEKIPYHKAIIKLAERIGIDASEKYSFKPKYTDKQQKIIDALNEASKFFQFSLQSDEGKEALKFLEGRKVTRDQIEKYKIGYSPIEKFIEYMKSKEFDEAVLINASLLLANKTPFFKNRIIFPIINVYGDVVGFSARKITGEGPKYINSIESIVFNKAKILYNINNAIDSMNKTKEVYITEGFMDTIALNEIGFENTVAIMGTALSKHHLSLIKDKKVHLMFDYDEAGFRATIKSLKLLISNKIDSDVIYYRGEKDPDEILKHEGPEKLKEIINKKIPGIEYIYKVLVKKHNPTNPNEIKLMLQEFAEYLQNTSSLEKDFYINLISRDFNISKEIVSKFFPNYSYEGNGQEIKPILKDDVKVSLPKTNYEYKLIRSMLKKPLLVKIFQKNEASFNDIILKNIAKYLVQATEGAKIKPDDEIRKKVGDILSESNEVVVSVEDFRNLIEIVNKNYKKSAKNKLSKELKQATTNDEKIEFLKKIKELNKR